jgi:hypothetical protein
MSVWFLLASGPSLTQADVDAVRGHGTVVAINCTIANAPWADILYACDAKWWRHYSRSEEYGPVLRMFKGERCCLKTPGIDTPEGVNALPYEDAPGLGRSLIRAGGNSGYQAINFAYLRGARTIVLLGYDMQATGGRNHHHPDHPQRLGNFDARMAANCAPKFSQLADDLRSEGVRVINCTRSTALRCFERMPLEHALALIGN